MHLQTYKLTNFQTFLRYIYKLLFYKLTNLQSLRGHNIASLSAPPPLQVGIQASLKCTQKYGCGWGCWWWVGVGGGGWGGVGRVGWGKQKMKKTRKVIRKQCKTMKPILWLFPFFLSLWLLGNRSRRRPPETNPELSGIHKRRIRDELKVHTNKEQIYSGRFSDVPSDQIVWNSAHSTRMSSPRTFQTP